MAITLFYWNKYVNTDEKHNQGLNKIFMIYLLEFYFVL